jgi:peptide/nickel transport system substrate-binding protein
MPDQGGFNSGYYSNPEVDELLEAARVDRPGRARAALQGDADHRAGGRALGLRRQLEAERGDEFAVENFTLEPSFFLLLDDVVKN